MIKESLPPSGVDVHEIAILDANDSKKTIDGNDDRNNKFASIIVRAISMVLGVSVDEIYYIADTTTFIKLGGNSLSAILISAECQRKGILVPAGVFLRISTVKEVITTAASLAQRISSPIPTIIVTEDTSDDVNDDISGDEASSIYTSITTPDPETEDLSLFSCGKEVITAESLLSKIDTTEWTEPQLLLLRETSQNHKLNILTIHESYTGDWDVQDVCDAWMNTIVAEPIFKDLLDDLDVLPQQLLPREIIQTDSDEDLQKETLHAAHATGPISRLTVVQSSSPSASGETAKSTTVVWRIHHAFMDGYSAHILRDKITRTLRGGEFVVPAGPSFRETVRFLGVLREERSESTRRFWNSKREKFPTATGELCLSPQRIAKTAEVTPQKSATIQFPSRQLAEAVTRTGYTTTVFFAAAWALTLGKFVDVDQVCFGVVFSGRDLPIPGAFDVVGPLINILPLFVQVPTKGDETSVETFLRRIHDDILDLSNVQHSDTTEGFDRKLYSIMATQFECDEEEVPSPIHIDRNRPDMQSGIPLNIVIKEECRLQMLYSTAHFADEDMSNLQAVFKNSMNCLLQGNDANRLVSSVNDALLPQDMEKTIRDWSNCASFETLDESKGDDLVTLFESVVARQPNDLAIIHGELEVSYDDLDQAAAIVAQKLSLIEPNEAVCVYADRSVNWLVAIFGVLKAGGVYAPLDPSAPVSMRQANFIRSGARAVLVPSRATSRRIVSSRQEEDDAAPFQCLVLGVDDLLAADSAQARNGFEACYPRRRIARPDDLAYICFTSGSTGQPKAVQCTHKGLVAFQKDRVVRLGASKGVVVAQIMSPVFDGSIHEIFSALTHGATLRLASPDHQGDPFSHLRDSDVAILTPSIAKALDPNQYPRLKNVYLVGEAVPQSLCETWTKNRSLYNMYGPTEATCGTTIKQLFPNEAVSLGRPNPSSRVYILDRSLSLLPPGVVGELYIAGIQVSCGYIKLPEQNASRFLEDSVMPETGQKMYRTGDYAYWNSATGDICILGRKDRQIKLNGFRLDLDDLEARVAKAIPGCGGTAIFRRDDHLIAAYQTTSPDEISTLDVKAFISNTLPPYAMPQRIVAFNEFPLTAAGKLDYKTIEKSISASLADTNIEALPQKRTIGATEIIVVSIVRDFMKLDPSVPVDHDSNLTELGCHSILQLQLASRISSLVKRHFPVRKVIENLVVSRLASAIDDILKEDNVIDVAISEPLSSLASDSITLGESEVSSIERDWFLKYQRNLGTSSFNVSHVSELDASFDQHQALVSAWNVVLARHDILRCRFRQSADGSVERSYAVKSPKAVYAEDFDVRAAINKEFLLESEDPIRVLLSKRYMLVCVSHIICDYTTLNRLFEELAAVYFNDHSEELSLAPQKRYQDTTYWNLDVDQATANFWKSYLSGIDVSEMPPYMKKPRTSYHGESLLFRLSKDTMTNLRTVSRSLRLTLHQIALAVVSLVLQADNPSKQDLFLGSPYLGRQEDDMRTIGLFLQPLPIRIRRRSNQDESDFKEASLATFLQAVQESSRSSLGHAIHWDSLMDILASSDDEKLRLAAATEIPNNPLFDAMVTFHELDTTGKSSSSTIPGIQPLVNWAEGAKFGIMFEFSAVSSSSVTLRVEYDTSLFSSDEVRLFVARIDSGLRYFCETPESVTLGELEGKLSDVGVGGLSGRIENVEFGTPIAALT